jgi:O-acetyl-ADP-ribose deacetylase (regulator of RNase III)
LPYRAVLHAVAVDPLYHTNDEILTECLEKSFVLVEEFQAESMALTCLATGFGDAELSDFAEVLKPFLKRQWRSLKTVYLAQIEEYRFEELKEVTQPHPSARGFN